MLTVSNFAGAALDVRRPLQDVREKDPSFVSDAYAECYPAFHDFGTTVVDSDEEDLSHMDAKGKLGARESFTTEEQWQQVGHCLQRYSVTSTAASAPFCTLAQLLILI